MVRREICGEWHLAASTSVVSELDSPADDESGADSDDVARWLNGGDGGIAAAAPETAGLLLTITHAGSFTERVTGRPGVDLWFDAGGMLTDGVSSPFDGSVVDNGQVAWLRPRGLPPFARPVQGRYAPAVLRYDDGDTRIADGLRVVGADLVRTVNVVTDELYLDRVVLVYRRATGPG